RGRAQRIIDTTDLKRKVLREKILGFYSEEKQDIFSVNMLSFGFKHGVPIDADLVFDVRFLTNPHYVEYMQPWTGLTPDVASYVFKWTETQKFNDMVLDLLTVMLTRYKKQGN